MASRDNQRSTADLQMVPAGGGDSAQGKGGEIVEYNKGSGGVVLREDQEDIEVKLRRIMDLVPVRVNNTSGSSAGSGSGDFHQYRQMRRKEQDRLTRMDTDYQRRKEIAEFNVRREERLKAAEDRTAKKRLKRQKKKQKKKEKKARTTTTTTTHDDGSSEAAAGGGENHRQDEREQEEESSDNSSGRGREE